MLGRRSDVLRRPLAQAPVHGLPIEELDPPLDVGAGHLARRRRDVDGLPPAGLVGVEDHDRDLRPGGDVARVPRLRIGHPEELPALCRGVPDQRDQGEGTPSSSAVPMVMNRSVSMILRAITPSSSPSTVTSPKGRPAPRATSGRRARHPPQPTPLVLSSHFARPRWRRRPVVSSPGATVGRCCLLDARRSSGDAVRLRR